MLAGGTKTAMSVNLVKIYIGLASGQDVSMSVVITQ